jgi:hypothetical protein
MLAMGDADGIGPDLGFAVLCVIPSGIGVGLALPTLMGLGTSTLPGSSFATGSGVINMVRQIGLAVGVAIFVAIVGSPGSAEAYGAAFRLAWWVMAVITALGLLPLLLLRQSKASLVAANGKTRSMTGQIFPARLPGEMCAYWSAWARSIWVATR